MSAIYEVSEDGKVNDAEDPNDIGKVLDEIDGYRMSYIRKNVKEDGTFSDNVDPKVLLKCMADTSISLSRRQAQALLERSEASMDQYRQRSLAIIEMAQQQSSKLVGDSTNRQMRQLPTLDGTLDATFTEDEIAQGVVKLNPAQFAK